jgi:methyl-accepting chemotaxis protein
VPLALVVPLTLRIGRDALLDANRGLLAHYAAAAQARLEMTLARARADALAWAADDAAITAAGGGSVGELQTRLDSIVRTQPGVSLVLMTDRRGRIVAHNAVDAHGKLQPASLRGRDLSAAAWWPKAWNRTGDPELYVSAAATPELAELVGDTAHVIFPAYVNDEMDDPSGRLLVLSPVRSFAPLLGDGTREHAVMLFDGAGAMVLSSFGGAAMRSLGELAPGLVEGASAEGLGPDGGPALLHLSGSTGAVAKLGWRVAAAAPKMEVLRAVGVLERTALAVSALVLCIGVLAGGFLVRRQVRPIGRLTSAAAWVVSTGDLTTDIEVRGSDEIGTLAGSLRELIAQQRSIVTRMRDLTERLGRVTDEAARVGQTVAAGADDVQLRVADASSAVEAMMSSLTNLDRKSSGLRDSAETSTATVVELAASNQAVAESVGAMQKSVEQIALAIEEINGKIHRTAGSVETFRAFIDTTTSSMLEMTASIRRVQESAGETSRLSGRTALDAENGAEALAESTRGVGRIEESAQAASRLVTGLAEQIDEVDAILAIITDVADQTALLSLNAAIIAAHAGEHGKGFGVVADEIKALAERTRKSTTEISQLIVRIKGSSADAQAAMEKGIASVKDGVALARRAEQVLQKILESSRFSATMASSIAAATGEQVQTSDQVAQATAQLQSMIEDLAKVSHEQAEGAERIVDATVHMKRLVEHVRRSADEQARGSTQLSSTMDGIADLVADVSHAQAEQANRSSAVLHAVDAIAAEAVRESQAVKRLAEAIELLNRHAGSLQTEISRFKVET